MLLVHACIYVCFPAGIVVKNMPANAEDTGSVPESGRSPAKERLTHSSILAWRIPWTEEPGRLQSMGSQNRTGLNDEPCTHE